MTSNSSGFEPPLPTGNRSFPLPPTRIVSHDLQQTPRSWPRQISNPTLNAPASSQDASEPPLKRQRIGEFDKDLTGKMSGGIANVLHTSHSANKKTLLVNSADSLSDSVDEDKDWQNSLVPIRPVRAGQFRGHQQGRALPLERANARDVVAVKPYVPEPPSFAPRLHDAGKRSSLFAKTRV